MPAGFARIAACTPTVHLGKIYENQQEILQMMKLLREKHVQAAVFPELCLCGATLGDLLLRRETLDNCMAALCMIARETDDMAVVVGLPVDVRGRVYNCAAVLKNGKIHALVPKTCLTREEKRWFVSGRDVCELIWVMGEAVALTDSQLYDAGEFTFGVIMGQELSAPLSRAGRMAVCGAEILLSPCAQNAQSGRSEGRRRLLAQQSAALYAGVACANAGAGESTADMVFDGYRGVYEVGEALAEGEPYETGFTVADVDVQRLRYQRRRDGAFFDAPCEPMSMHAVGTAAAGQTELLRPMKRLPFVPEDPAALMEMARIQCEGLASRMRVLSGCKLVIGVSGGLDSTLALLVAARTCDGLNRPRSDIHAITMPGMGTGARTKGNADRLMQALGVSHAEISIEAAVRQHFADIGQPEDRHDVTYENAQARERTQILMDVANQVGGIVLGTGDLSESALGFCTFNGDHMSMYNVNCGVTKTLARSLVAALGAAFGGEVAAICADVVDTPISPELLPAAQGELQQRTEDILGDYELHDFFLYHYLDGGADPERLMRMAEHTFGATYAREVIAKQLSTFLRRFHNQQFKRNCVPDGAKVTPFSLNPRGDWKMPSDL